MKDRSQEGGEVQNATLAPSASSSEMKERRGGTCSPDTDQSLALTLNHGGCHSTPDLSSEPQGVGSIGAEHHGTFRQGNNSSSSPPPRWCVITTGCAVQGVHAAVAGVTGWDGGIVFHRVWVLGTVTGASVAFRAPPCACPHLQLWGSVVMRGVGGGARQSRKQARRQRASVGGWRGGGVFMSAGLSAPRGFYTD